MPALAEPIGSRTLLELGDAVVLRAKRHQVRDWGIVAPLDVGAQELAALRKAHGVECRRRRENRVRSEVGADLIDLIGNVSEEGGPPVVGRVVVEVDIVHEGARIDFFGQSAYGLQAGCKVAEIRQSRASWL